MLSVNVGVKSASGSAFGQESSATLLWVPYLLPVRLTDQRYNDFSGNSASSCASSCEAERGRGFSTNT
jgi:hypothetical protein